MYLVDSAAMPCRGLACVLELGCPCWESLEAADGSQLGMRPWGTGQNWASGGLAECCLDAVHLQPLLDEKCRESTTRRIPSEHRLAIDWDAYDRIGTRAGWSSIISHPIVIPEQKGEERIRKEVVLFL